ncbi:hypothetical protein HUJ04_000214 [Dendroctonus ponderosae]|nr:hypothetical protein HUJ04_000214 [Dendroctonus ponderosae]
MGSCLFGRVLRAQCVVLVLVGAVGGAVAPKKGVSVAKCCALNATLTSDNKCQRAINASWDLRVYLNGTFRAFTTLPPKWTLREGVQPRCAAPVLEPVALRSAIPFINGYLMSVRFQRRLAPSQFCLDYDYVMFCPEAPEQISGVLVNKCCGSGAVFSDTNASCVLFPGAAYALDLGPNKTLGAGFPECSDDHAVAGRLQEGRLHDNGSLQLNATGLVLGPANYCLEHILEHAGGGSPSVITCRRYLGAEGPPAPSLKLTIYPIGLAVSAIFLAATLAAGSLLPSSHHVLHWRCQTNHVACLLVGDVLLCITQIAGGHFPFWPCFLIGKEAATPQAPQCQQRPLIGRCAR